MTGTLDPFVGLAHMFGQPFLRSAFEAGTAIALACGLVGTLVVVRGQVFTGDALSHVAFTGALAALALGADLRIGLYGACIGFALLMAVLGRRMIVDDTVIGTVFAWVLGLGSLFLSLYTTAQSGAGGTGDAGVSVLFGSILGLSPSQALTDVVVSTGVVVVLVATGRPLLFTSVDRTVAAARGLPVGRLDAVFFVLLGVTAGMATQAVGALLLLGLIAAPAGAAQALTARPLRALWLSAAIAVGSMWAGLTLAYLAPSVPPSFGILAVATGAYGASALGARLARHHRLGRRARTGNRGTGAAATSGGAPARTGRGAVVVR